MRRCVLLALLLGPLPAQGVGLGAVADLARARAEAQRPAMTAALEPQLADLELDRERSTAVVDDAIAKTAALGDAVVPLLLELLTPADSSEQAHHLAANVTLVLTRLDLETMLDALVELSQDQDVTARRHAIELLGLIDDPVAERAVAGVYPRLTSRLDRQIALTAAARQQSPLLAQQALALLGDADTDTRGAAIRYLAVLQRPADFEPMLAGFQRETERRLLPPYISYLCATGEENPQLTADLLAAIQGGRLSGQGLLLAVRGLGTIAPKGDRDTRKLLRKFLEDGETGPLGIACAKSLEQLGDKRSARILFDTLEQRIDARRNHASPYIDRAEALIAFGKWRDAIRDYEQAIRLTSARARRGAYWLEIARCEAHRDSSSRMLRALEESGLGKDAIRREAAKDPVFAGMLDKDSARRFLQRLDH